MEVISMNIKLKYHGALAEYHCFIVKALDEFDGKGILGKLFYGILKMLLKISEWQGKPNLNVLFNYNMPIRGYAKMTGGFVTMEMAEALTEMANGHRIKGTAHLIRAAAKRD